MSQIVYEASGSRQAPRVPRGTLGLEFRDYQLQRLQFIHKSTETHKKARLLPKDTAHLPHAVLRRPERAKVAY